MPETKVVLYREDDGTVPFLDWLDSIPIKVLDKCRVRIERLEELGHELRRPECDYLGQGIYELRVGFQSVNYRMLYFFHGSAIVVLSHGLTKEQRVPSREIDQAVERMKKYQANPERHTYEDL
ncbi:MAG: type II toxin-antitoxin system RelE/ParE family toxin [bacterium]